MNTVVISEQSPPPYQSESLGPEAELLLPWLMMNRLPGTSPSRLNAYLDMFHSPQAFLKAEPSVLKQAKLSAESLELVIEAQNRPGSSRLKMGAAKDLIWSQLNEERHILTLDDPRYPECLSQLADPPIVLFVEGDWRYLNRPQLAIVGSRKATMAGLENAAYFAAQIAKEDWVITSGMALGVDGAAHQGALDMNKPTIAVLGCGLDQVYPARHKKLAENIRYLGAMVSEFPIGVPPRAHHFPRRNRVIAGLSQGVLVIEAAKGSGSLITAIMALEEGREVFALPGNVRNPLASGCHQLIQQGAKLVTSVEDVIQELSEPLFSARNFQKPARKQIQLLASTSKQEKPEEIIPDAEQRSIYAVIDHDPTPLDLISSRCGILVQNLSSPILMLEMQGLIHLAPGGYLRS